MNPSDARLRRLDALFAEKVLGCNVRESRFSQGCFVCDCNTEPNHQDHLYLKAYTRSLDCAWEGAEKNKYFRVAFCSDRIDECEYTASLSSEAEPWKGSINIVVAPHPAEALVLACLRAVGCTEEELK